MENLIMTTDCSDFDVIRVEDTYYMLSASVHFMPGGRILRSYDLRNWEIVSYLFDRLDRSPAGRLKGELNRYGYGMKGGALTYHEGMFYATFCDYEAGNTYIFTSKKPEGPWEMKSMKEEYYYNSLFFDDDGTPYVIYGYRTIYLQELEKDLSGPKKTNGKFCELVSGDENCYVPFFGVHFQKINGTYYLLVTDWPKTKGGMKTQYCFSSDKIDGTYTGGVLVKEDLGCRQQGLSQGMFVDTPDGNWYLFLGQDRGAVGRRAIIFPVHFENGVPYADSKHPLTKPLPTEKKYADYEYEPLVCSDDFQYVRNGGRKPVLKKQWQWNHEPSSGLWWIGAKGISIKTGKISANLIHARNTLTQKCIYPGSRVEVTLEAKQLNDGDFAGLCVLQACYGLVGVTKELNQYYLVVVERDIKDSPFGQRRIDYLPGDLVEKIPMEETKVTLMIETNFANSEDCATFYYKKGNEYCEIGEKHKLYFKADHFTGARYGLCVYATEETGGIATFSNFVYHF